MLEHRRLIESAFSGTLNAMDDMGRTAAMKRLQLILTGHANAEEAVLYPALSEIGEKADMGMAFKEQAMTKVQFAALEKLYPSSQAWRDKLEHIQGALLDHIYQEESSWFPRLGHGRLRARRDGDRPCGCARIGPNNREISSGTNLSARGGRWDRSSRAAVSRQVESPPHITMCHAKPQQVAACGSRC